MTLHLLLFSCFLNCSPSTEVKLVLDLPCEHCITTDLRTSKHICRISYRHQTGIRCKGVNIPADTQQWSSCLQAVTVPCKTFTCMADNEALAHYGWWHVVICGYHGNSITAVALHSGAWGANIGFVGFVLMFCVSHISWLARLLHQFISGKIRLLFSCVLNCWCLISNNPQALFELSWLEIWLQYGYCILFVNNNKHISPPQLHLTATTGSLTMGQRSKQAACTDGSTVH